MTLMFIILVLWLLGVLTSFGGVTIHGLLVVCLILFIVEMLNRRRVP